MFPTVGLAITPTHLHLRHARGADREGDCPDIGRSCSFVNDGRGLPSGSERRLPCRTHSLPRSPRLPTIGKWYHVRPDPPNVWAVPHSTLCSRHFDTASHVDTGSKTAWLCLIPNPPISRAGSNTPGTMMNRNQPRWFGLVA
jgi:hypothetical protein